MKRYVILVLLLLPCLARAVPEGVIRLVAEQPVDAVYDRVYKALEAEKFWVVFEADMGKRMAKFGDKWGNDYNRNGLDSVKSMVFCNIWWTNRVANADPDLLALCPLHLSLYEKDGDTVLVMPKLSVLAEGSPGQGAAAELESELTAIVQGAMSAD
jgi:uncharacterized protein (DUF302 family)